MKKIDELLRLISIEIWISTFILLDFMKILF